MAPPKTQRLLLKGVQGDDVRDAQRKLNFRLDPSKRIDEDGIFGDNTDTAVRDFQRRNTLSVDGRIGPQTWNAPTPKSRSSWSRSPTGARSDLCSIR
jgi:peptidoglycan hydrolase-like protein with peptidoglycan-binding domain